MSDMIMNGYMLDAPFSNENAGFCKWTFAHKNGKEYFLKELLNPVYPVSNKLQERTKAIKITECRQFELKQLRLIEAINSGSFGNVVRIEEFFRYDSHYYLATKKIEDTGISVDDLIGYPFDERLFLCESLAYTAHMLHSAYFVHGDIKESNIILKKTAGGRIIGKIIDFDGGFLESAPPQYEDELVGDQIYFAPEACEFLYGEDIVLTSKIDVFAFGLLFHKYLTGRFPDFDTEKYRFAHEAVLDGVALKASDELPEEIRALLEKMLLKDPDQRANMMEAVQVIKRYMNRKSAAETSESEKTVSSASEISNSTESADYFAPAGNL